MAQTNGIKNEACTDKLTFVVNNQEAMAMEGLCDSTNETQEMDDILSSLKGLLPKLEKLQKIRQEVCDIKHLIERMLYGEIMALLN